MSCIKVQSDCAVGDLILYQEVHGRFWFERADVLVDRFLCGLAKTFLCLGALYVFGDPSHE